MSYRVKDISLAELGKKKIDWAEVHMPVIVSLRKKYEASQPLRGVRITGCLHVTKETGVLIRTLKAAGAELSWCGCNPLSTQDDVAASIVNNEGVSVFAVRGVSTEQYYQDIHSAMDIRPNITIDDGADLTVEMHKEIDGLASTVRGGTEETTTGVVRLRAMERAGKLKYPIIAVNDEHIVKMKNGAILANAGHFNVEISIDALDRNSLRRKNINEHTIQYELYNGNKVYLIGEGRLVNLAAAEGHPSEVMDMTFANQFVAVLKLAQHAQTMKPLLYNIDRA